MKTWGGPAVRGRAAGKMRPTKAPNSRFAASVAIRSLRPTCSSFTAVAERQKRNRLCPPRRFANLRDVMCNANLG